MKKLNFLFLLVMFFTLLINSKSYSQLLIDDFNYSGLLTANGWTAHSGTTNPINTTSGLTYSGYPGSSLGNAALIGNLGGEDVNRGFTEQNINGAEIYYSFLVNVNELASDKTGDYFIHLGDRVTPTNFTFFAGRVFAKISSDTVNFGLSNTSTPTYGTTGYNKNTTYLLIVKYVINTAGNDTTKLWVFNSGIPSNEISAGTPEVINGSTAGQNVIDAVGLRQGSNTAQPQVIVDGLRIATSWASLLPTPFTSIFTVYDKWNLISFPGIHPNIMHVDTLYRFRASGTSVFSFSGSSYNPVDTILNGTGYWLKHNGQKTYRWNGTVQGGVLYPKLNYATVTPFAANAGWNLIGAYEYEFLTSQLTTNPPGLIIGQPFGYVPGSGYQPALSFEPSKGYWILLSGAGEIIFPDRPTALKETNQELFDKNWSKIIISDAADNNYTLYVTENEKNINRFLLPPKPPADLFDVRFTTDRMVDVLTTEKSIEISGAVYPIKVSVIGMNILVKDAFNGDIVSRELKDGEELIIGNPLLNKLTVIGSEISPLSFELSQNYPNPFNPSTKIRYAIAKSGLVTLKVYNSIGEEVAELVNSVQEAGRYEVVFNSSSLASGIYLYKITSGDFVETRKMILLK